MGFKLSNKNRDLMLYLFVASLIIIAIDESFKIGSVVNYFLGPSMITISFLLLEKSEKQFVYIKVKEITSKILFFQKRNEE
jgi:hypothetical protein